MDTTIKTLSGTIAGHFDPETESVTVLRDRLAAIVSSGAQIDFARLPSRPITQPMLGEVIAHDRLGGVLLADGRSVTRYSIIMERHLAATNDPSRRLSMASVLRAYLDDLSACGAATSEDLAVGTAVAAHFVDRRSVSYWMQQPTLA